jgi:uncharacterized protein YcnI
MRRTLGALGVIVAALVATAAPAAAHVTIQPSEAKQGGFATVFVQVPNEKADAATTQIELTLPEDHPIAYVSVEPVPGWTITPQRSTLATPIKAEGGEITEAVTKITFSGGRIEPGQFQRFPISVGPLPTDTDELVFKAVQTYSDGEEVRWIDVGATHDDEGAHPAPTLALVKATDDHGSGQKAETTAATTDSHDDSSSSDTLAIVAIAVGGIGVVLALVALLRKARPAA